MGVPVALSEGVNLRFYRPYVRSSNFKFSKNYLRCDIWREYTRRLIPESETHL
jgi:hypothetical protein